MAVTSEAVTTETPIVINGVTYEKLTDTTLIVSSYVGTESSIVIPTSPIDGFTVTEIGESAFEGNTVLESITLPDTITIIHKRAFAGCSNLREMK